MSEAAAALVVAIVGAATGIAALAWNVSSWRREGPLVKLDARMAGDRIVATAWNLGRAQAHIIDFRFKWIAGGPKAHEKPEEMAHVPLENVRGEYRVVPPHDHVTFSISDLELISDDLPRALLDGRVVRLQVRTGRRQKATAYVLGRRVT